MSVRSIRFSRVAVLGVIAALCLAANLRSIQAATLTINPALSTLNVSINVGVFTDGQGSNTNAETGNPYGPGDVGPGPDPEDPNLYPVNFNTLGGSVGQGDPSAAAFLVPGGVVPIFSDGSSAQINGTISVTPGGFQIDSAAAGLNPSGLWQPTNPLDTNALPTASELGVILDLNNVIPAAYAVARLNSTSISISTGAVSLDGFGNFSDPNGVVSILNSNVIGFAQLPEVLGGAVGLNTTITNESATTTVAGTYTSVGPLATLTIPNLVATTYVGAGDTVPGLYIQLVQTSNIVATAVPEPSTIALVGMGLVGLVVARFRRK